jgi:nucleotide-binding universal stress UspA family protein
MFQHLLVPLDGSSLAEAALPVAAALAAALDARVTLIHIIEERPPSTVHGERHLGDSAEATAYLEAVRRQAFAPEAAVTLHVHIAPTEDVAQGIVAHQAELGPDLIVLCTHGRGGLRRLLVGSIAQQVVGAGRTPVLLVRPEARPETFPYQTVLVPVDGDSRHEPGLAVGAELAGRLGATLRLLSVIPTPSTLAGRSATLDRFLPASNRRVLAVAEEERRAYLGHLAKQWHQKGVKIDAEVRRGEVAGVIADAADAAIASLVVLATHGRAGTKAFWSDSTAARVQAQTTRPLLLVPLSEKIDSEPAT